MGSDALTERGVESALGKTAGVAVLGWSVHLPGVDPAAIAGCDLGAACGPDQARDLLGRKGLRYRDSATRLALCAVHRALGLAPQASRRATPPDPRTAVVASSNLSNVGTVRSVMASVAAGGKREVSAMEAPNTSSNVVASTVGLWFRWGGPNLMICSGATAGLDAVATGMLLLRARRADRVVVVGVEAGDEVARELHAGGSARGRDRGTPLREGAACLILARPDRATDRVPLLGPVLSSCEVSVGPDMQTPAAVVGQVAHRGTRVVDLTALVGDCYGAAGVVQVAVAAALAPAAGGPVAIVCGDDIDGWRATWLHPGAVRGGA